MALTALAVRATGHDGGLFTGDVRAVASHGGLDLPIYVGAISVLNNLIWAAAAALTLCAAALDGERRRWHLAFGGLLLILAADDSYMLHENSGSRWLEVAFYAVYAFVGVWLALVGVRELDGQAAMGYFLGCGFLLVAAYLDVATGASYLPRDGAKLMGTLVWLTVPIASLVRANTRRLYETGELPDRRSPTQATRTS